MVSKQNRRTFLKTVGASGTTAIALSSAATVSAEDKKNTTITVKDDSANDALIERARELDYQRVSEVSGEDKYKIMLLSEKTPSSWKEDMVDNSTSSMGTQEIAGGPPEVPLGEDQSFGDMEIGDSWGNWSGDVVGNAGASTDLSADRAEASALAASGLGEIDQYAWVGKPFQVTGNGSQTADVTISGDWQGRVLTTPSGSIEVIITAFVENQTTGAVWESQIHQNSGSFIDGYVYNHPSLVSPHTSVV
ncbi:Vng6162h (plasmid) [Halobacterium salinarum NRC-1]|uniref:Vng6162h n=1 Tax=Halobacterium salinarum (strain ATCC 700922 / JCM 11081 / NRC-1) TaxID=64091 RepID=Q9HHZ0_HALSA|nr:hypothetical protein [Halobacterium salinarum]AAG20833.1 Vng6162h [Halobacterium salinarum NRC-1]